MHIGGAKKIFFKGEWFCRPDVPRKTLWGGFSRGSDTGCGKHTSPQRKKLYKVNLH